MDGDKTLQEGFSFIPVRTTYNKPYKNLYDTLAASAARVPDKIGVIDAERQVSYIQLRREVDALALGLSREHGLRRGSAVGLLMDNSVSFLRAFYAVVKLGCTVVALNTKQQGPEILHCLTEAGASVLLLQQKWQYKLDSILQESDVQIALLDQMEAEGNASVQSLIRAHLEGPKMPADQDPPPAVIMYTSGTTGTPKGAMITHQNILGTAYGYEDVLGVHQDSVTVLSVPIFHILGLSCVSTLFIYLGATLVLEPVFRAKQTLKNLVKHRATHFHSAPTVYIYLANALEESEEYDLSSLKTCVCGGAFLPREDRDRFCRHIPGASFRTAYGMTETAGGGLMSRRDKELPAPCGNAAIMVADEGYHPLKLGETGQIMLGGASVISGYCKGRGADSFHDGWLSSGDLGRINPDGTVEILGRLKELINRGGEKVFPSVVEAAVTSCPSVEQAAVFAIPDPLYGEVPAAAVTLKKGCALTAEDLRSYLAHKLARYEIPVLIDIRKEIPYTASGKMAKRMLAEELAAVYREDNREQNKK